MKTSILRTLPINDLCVLYDAMIRARDAIFSIANQPRASDLAEILDEEAEKAASAAQRIVAELSRRRPAKNERDVFARVVIDWNVFQCCGDGESEVFRAAFVVLQANAALIAAA